MTIHPFEPQRLVPLRRYCSGDGSSLPGVVAPDADDAWYRLFPEGAVDREDMSWANRGRLARGRFARPCREGTDGVADATMAG